MLEEEKQHEIFVDADDDAKELSRGQKMAAAALGFFAFFIVIVWAFQFKGSIANPLEKRLAELTAESGSGNGGTELCPNGRCQDLADDELRAKDTDEDGLSDYDELNIYGTSPYLEDSDSDGFLDKAEIDSNNNPLCPAGRECDTVASEEASSGLAPDLNLADQGALDLAAMEKLLAAEEQAAETSAASQDNNPEAAQLRATLKASGIGDDILSAFSDDELLKIYAEAIKE